MDKGRQGSEEDEAGEREGRRGAPFFYEASTSSSPPLTN